MKNHLKAQGVSPWEYIRCDVCVRALTRFLHGVQREATCLHDIALANASAAAACTAVGMRPDDYALTNCTEDFVRICGSVFRHPGQSTAQLCQVIGQCEKTAERDEL